MTLPGQVPDSLISSRDRCSTHRSRFLSFRDRSRPAGTGPGDTGTGDFPPTTLRTGSRTYRGSCREGTMDCQEKNPFFNHRA